MVDNPVARVNGKEVRLDVPPKIENGRTLVPIRFVAENMETRVTWHEREKKVVVKSKAGREAVRDRLPAMGALPVQRLYHKSGVLNGRK